MDGKRPDKAPYDSGGCSESGPPGSSEKGGQVAGETRREWRRSGDTGWIGGIR